MMRILGLAGTPRRLALSVVILGSCLWLDDSIGAEIGWRTSGRKSQQLALQMGQPLVIYVETESCRFCRLLEQTTWANETVAARVGAGFVPLRIESQQSPKIVRQLGVRAFPTTVVLAPNGKVLGRQVGYTDSQKMLDFLRPFAVER